MANTSRNSGITQQDPNISTEYGLARVNEIRSRAFALYESRGRADGHDLDDWLHAERQVTFLSLYNNSGE